MEEAGNGITAPYFSYEDLRQKANAFLAKYHPDGTIPVPIEEIVEFQLGIDIVPMPRLHELCEVDGFLTSDRRAIYVDDFVYRKRIRRYRFTLAHEVGHLLLHSEIYNRYQQLHGSKIDEWKRFINAIPEKEHRWFEHHGYTFAGLVLVPYEHLLKETEAWVERIKTEGLDLAENWDFAWTQIGEALVRPFEVSSQVINKRLAKEEIPKRFA